MSKDIEKKKIILKRNIIITVVLMIAMGVGGVVAYNTFFKETKASIPSQGANDIKYEAIKRDTIYDFSSGEMKITRNRVEDKSSELDDSWTVLMYVCGSDTDRTKEAEITKQIASFLQEKCGLQIV